MIVVRLLLCGGGQLAWRAQLRGRLVGRGVCAGTCLLVESLKRRRTICGTSVSEGAMSMTMEQVVAQRQQEVFTLKAQVADQSGLTEAVRATNILANAPRSERHSDSHRFETPWSSERILWPRGGLSTVVEETEAFFAGVIKETG